MTIKDVIKKLDWEPDLLHFLQYCSFERFYDHDDKYFCEISLDWNCDLIDIIKEEFLKDVTKTYLDDSNYYLVGYEELFEIKKDDISIDIDTLIQLYGNLETLSSIYLKYNEGTEEIDLYFTQKDLTLEGAEEELDLNLFWPSNVKIPNEEKEFFKKWLKGEVN